MNKKYLWLLLFLLGVSGCAKAPEPIVLQIPEKPIDYLTEVKPVLDARCVVCHSCYNSPCQLKLSSFEGLDRGSSKEAVYNGSRLQTMDPSRLFTDAQATEEWRDKGFSSVTENSAREGYNNSVMLLMVNHKMQNPVSKGDYFAEADDLTCASSHIEVGEYLKKHPNNGMPFGFPPLKENEFQTVAGWLMQGAKGPTPEEQKRLISISPFDLMEVDKWETFLNGSDPKHRMTARYLYEHLFLAHLKLPTASGAFYELVRSKTPSPEPIDIIATVRPYDDPGTDRVYYRFRKIHSTIVHKTHMVFELDDQKLQRFQELFIVPEWNTEPYIIGYDPIISANPFKSFDQIPSRSRYQFLLDNSHYIIMTFIRGPVCKGQVALNVINDHFWVMFMDPDYDLSVNLPGYLKIYANKLAMPHEGKSDYKLLEALLNPYYKKASEFRKHRRDHYAINYYDGLGYEAIWKGEKAADGPLLTVYRHFDSASVHKGALGGLPRTLWVLDFPVLERIYYSLVAGFDVYGAAGHQLATRLYMDALRIDGESNYLDFLPKEKRTEIMKEWYTGANFDKVHYPKPLMGTKIPFRSQDPKREFIENLIDYHFLRKTNIRLDRVNYMYAEEPYYPLIKRFNGVDDYLRAFHSVLRPGAPLLSHLQSSNANLAYVRIRNPEKGDSVVSLVVNRWHDNVTFLFREANTLNPEKDEADVISGFVGSYPNYFFDVHVDDLEDFFMILQEFDGTKKSIESLNQYGINRADERFWEIYDWFQARFNEQEPVRAGLFDLNRYYHYAR